MIVHWPWASCVVEEIVAFVAPDSRKSEAGFRVVERAAQTLASVGYSHLMIRMVEPSFLDLVVAGQFLRAFLRKTCF